MVWDYNIISTGIPLCFIPDTNLHRSLSNGVVYFIGQPGVYTYLCFFKKLYAFYNNNHLFSGMQLTKSNKKLLNRHTTSERFNDVEMMSKH